MSALFFLCLMWLIAFCWVCLTSILSAIISTIRQSYCPSCRQYFRLKCSSTTLVKSSFQAQGRERFTYHCAHCAYHRERNAVIPKRPRENARCPSCYGVSNMGQTERTLVEATYASQGKKQVVRHCSHCGHRWEYEEAISQLYYNDGADCGDP
jgi:hypothetical protein